ncbi:hypothetical protein AMTRI_Chr12g235830 [Amborella trichopoda]
MRKQSIISSSCVSMLLQSGIGSNVWLVGMAHSPRMPTLFFNRCEILLLFLFGRNLWRIMIATSLWTLWKERNLEIFEGRSRDILTLLSVIYSIAIMWAYASLPLMAVPNLLLFSCFKDLLYLESWFKLKFDGSVRGTQSGYDGLLRDHNSTFIWFFSGSLQYCEINEVELLAIKMGVSRLAHSHRKVIIEGDAANIILWCT